MDRIQRYRGCLLSLAVGDALGVTLEFRSPGRITEKMEYPVHGFRFSPAGT